MDAPDTPPVDPAAASSADSPVFDFINALSPIATPKRQDAVQNVQLFKSSDLAPVSSIFTSPQVNSQRGSKLSIRDASAQLPQKGMLGSTTVPSENCSINHSLIKAYHESSENASILPCNLLLIQSDSDTLENDKKQDKGGKTDHTKDQDHTELSSICFAHNGIDKMESSSSGRNVQEDDLAKQYNGELAACNWDYLTMTRSDSSVVPNSDLTFETSTQSVNRTIETDDVIHSKSFLQIDEANLENSRRKLFHGSTGCFIQSAADNVHAYCSIQGEGFATNYVSGIPPLPSQNQLVSNNQLCDILEVPNCYMAVDHSAVSHHLSGMHRRSLFNEKVRDSSMNVHSASSLHPASCTTTSQSIFGDKYLKHVGSPVCSLTSVGLHLNAVAPRSKDIVQYNNQATGDQSNSLTCTVNSSSSPLISEHNSQMNSLLAVNQLASYGSEMRNYIRNDHSSQTTIPMNADESCQENLKKKRQKRQNGDDDSCKHCSCKKSKCLKLYCECFAAKVYCSKSCSCRGCLNNHIHEEIVLYTRKQAESRNPLAFAPKVIHTCVPGQEIGEDSNTTPASSRHKRGCNCKKSYCLKKYCECFQSGVGCSMSCRCESCKNVFGLRKAVQLLATEEIDRLDRQKKVRWKEDQLKVDKQHAIDATGCVPSTEILLTTPSLESSRSLSLQPSACSKPPLSSSKFSSRLYNSLSPMKADVLPYGDMILGDGLQEGDGLSCNASVKVVSPNKKRVSPLRSGASLSTPIGRTGRKLLLSIPSFPSLTGDVNTEPK